jgi:hypothetical protein
MFQLIRRQLPLIIGGAMLVIVFDVVVLLQRAIGVQKGTAVYLSLLIFSAVASMLIRQYIRRK